MSFDSFGSEQKYRENVILINNRNHYIIQIITHANRSKRKNQNSSLLVMLLPLMIDVSSPKLLTELYTVGLHHPSLSKITKMEYYIYNVCINRTVYRRSTSSISLKNNQNGVLHIQCVYKK